jgi:tetratricopeptide (TPR) repeat protein
VASSLTHYFWAVADHDRAVEAGTRALALAAGLGDAELEVEVSFHLGIVYLSLGQYRRAVATLRQAVDSRPTTQHFSVRARAIARSSARAYLARSLAELGEFAQAIPCALESLELAERIDHAGALIGAQFGAGSVYLRKGDFAQAVEALEPALRLVRERHLDNWYPAVAATLGHALARSGQIEAGLRLLEPAVARAEAMGLSASRTMWLTYLGDAQLLAGNPGEARRSAERALESARTRKERGYEAWVLRLLGVTALGGARPDVRLAGAHFSQAIAIGEELEMRPLLALAHWGLARALQHGADPAEAARHLAVANSLLVELDMAAWRAHLSMPA